MVVHVELISSRKKKQRRTNKKRATHGARNYLVSAYKFNKNVRIIIAWYVCYCFSIRNLLNKVIYNNDKKRKADFRVFILFTEKTNHSIRQEWFDNTVMVVVAPVKSISFFSCKISMRMRRIFSISFFSSIFFQNEGFFYQCKFLFTKINSTNLDEVVWSCWDTIPRLGIFLLNFAIHCFCSCSLAHMTNNSLTDNLSLTKKKKKKQKLKNKISFFLIYLDMVT